MARKSRQVADEDEPAPPRAASDRDVDDLMRLLSWGRANGYRLGPTVQVGTVIAQVMDIRQAKKDLDFGGKPQDDDHPYAELTEKDVVVEGTIG